MNSKLIALLTVGIIASGLIYTHPAYAHNFGGDESASWLAKVSEIKTEANFISKHVGQKDVISYYSDALGEYWNTNDTREMGERTTLLATEIPTAINATISDAQAGNQSLVNDDVAKLGGYLDESVPVRVDKNKLNNSTVRALSVTFVLKESLEKYGDAINATVNLNDMSQMNVSAGSNMTGMSSGMSMVTIVDQNKYENAIGLAIAAQNMFTDVATKNLDKSDANSKISTAFTKLVQDLNNKADAQTIMNDVHVKMHPVFIDGYGLNLVTPVPEFPLPVILTVISIAGVVIATRFKSNLGF